MNLYWKTEKRKIKDLKFFDNNPRKMSKEQAEQLIISLKKFNLVEIPVVDQNNRIIAGNMRITALKKLGREDEEIEVRVPSRPLSEEEAKEYLLRSNKNTGEWDWDLLANFEIDLLKKIGFSSEEIDFFETNEDNFDFEKELEKIEKPKSNDGDLYQLGNHRLICGNNNDFETIKKLMNGEKADMIFTDPPYNIGLDYSKKISRKKKINNDAKFSDKKSDDDYYNFLDNVIKNLKKVVKDDSHWFFWCDENYIWLLQELYKENNIKNKRVCLWIKNNFNPTPQNAFNKVYEPCVYGTIGKPKLYNDKNLTEILNKNLQKKDDIYDYIINSLNVWLHDRDNVFEYKHTTQKPVELFEKAIKRCSKIDDLIVDVFGGSGSLLIACEQLKRRCFMCELNPAYVDVIIQRWEKYTGQKAKKINE